MRNKLLICFLAILLGTANIGPVFGQSQPSTGFGGSRELKRTMSLSGVSIFFINPGIGSCSGVLISETKYTQTILTAKHCVGPAEEVYVDHVKAAFYMASINDDLAAITIIGKVPNKVPVLLSKKPVKVGEYIYHIGYPTGQPVIKPWLSSGVVSRVTDDWGWAVIESTGGCSGGPIFNKDGKLVGILWGGYSAKGEKITVFEPLEDIVQFLKELSVLPIIKLYEDIDGIRLDTEGADSNSTNR